MRRISMHLFVRGVKPDECYDRISDFARYPELTAAVKEVVLHLPDPDGGLLSDWTVHFRKGLLCWTERDTFDRPGRAIDFTQTTGDFLEFTGSWRVFEAQGGSIVRFDAVFDLGIPTLAELLDPVAEATLRANILVILRGLLGQVDEVEPEPETVPATDGAR